MTVPFGDYELASCTVDCESAQIRLVAMRKFEGEPKFAELFFTGVVAYHFNNSCFGTILQSVVPIPTELFITNNQQQFNQIVKQGGSLRFWNDSTSSAIGYFQKHSLQAFEVVSAIGLDGWVVALRFDSQAISR